MAGPPVFLSNAHFCDVDPAVAETVVGLNCSLSEHVTLLDVEPTTGITMRAAKRLMMSTQYGPGQPSAVLMYRVWGLNPGPMTCRWCQNLLNHWGLC